MSTARPEQWNRTAYRLYVRGLSTRDQERDAAALLVHFVNECNGRALEPSAYPDPPDAVYRDAVSDELVAIEVKRLWCDARQRNADQRERFAGEVNAALSSPIGCLVFVHPGWVPPRRSGIEREQREALCKRIAEELERGAQRVDDALRTDPASAPDKMVDLSSVLPPEAQVAGSATAFMLSYGHGDGVTFFALPDEIAEALPVADREARYADLLRKANGSLRPYSRPGCTTVLLLDARWANQLLPYGLDEAELWHSRAGRRGAGPPVPGQVKGRDETSPPPL